MKRLWKASRHQNRIEVNNLEIPYKVEHRDVKHPRIEVKPVGEVLVILPRGVDNAEELLEKHKKWVHKKVSNIDELISDLDISDRDIEEKFILYGEPYELQFNRGRYNIQRENGKLMVSSPDNVEGMVRLKNWMKEDLREKLKNLSDEYSKKMGVKYKKIYLRSQKTKWASCSSKGNLSFNLRAGILPEDLLEHLVIHELTHLEVGKHNNEFWQKVGEYSKDYKQKEESLIGYWFLSYRNDVWGEMI